MFVFKERMCIMSKKEIPSTKKFVKFAPVYVAGKLDRAASLAAASSSLDQFMKNPFKPASNAGEDVRMANCIHTELDKHPNQFINAAALTASAALAYGGDFTESMKVAKGYIEAHNSYEPTEDGLFVKVGRGGGVIRWAEAPAELVEKRVAEMAAAEDALNAKALTEAVVATEPEAAVAQVVAEPESLQEEDGELEDELSDESEVAN